MHSFFKQESNHNPIKTKYQNQIQTLFYSSLGQIWLDKVKQSNATLKETKLGEEICQMLEQVETLFSAFAKDLNTTNLKTKYEEFLALLKTLQDEKRSILPEFDNDDYLSVLFTKVREIFENYATEELKREPLDEIIFSAEALKHQLQDAYGTEFAQFENHASKYMSLQNSAIINNFIQKHTTYYLEGYPNDAIDAGTKAFLKERAEDSAKQYFQKEAEEYAKEQTTHLSETMTQNIEILKNKLSMEINHVTKELDTSNYEGLLTNLLTSVDLIAKDKTYLNKFPPLISGGSFQIQKNYFEHLMEGLKGTIRSLLRQPPCRTVRTPMFQQDDIPGNDDVVQSNQTSKIRA